ncbi:hypothetical protein J5N97_010233 [Dioscorea zingiberensis]|uniref:Uncharacterized protein n=1 Tax=Dioscorea zingiberensis TaxID=325984 RepID=A0A9D5HMH9_9LILI|nr:hypothetical protein J5N97_010233 [Dioscorea zingiberensis]
MEDEDDGAALVAEKGRKGVESRGLLLLGLLLQYAEAVTMDCLTDARDILPEISELASLFD